ncbi:hypothetical protein F0267_01700 [Vibrio coralliilyticus]|uniref:Uncharacterized protein n=2 Tax=Vibrio TaxID=662 RepID=A0AAN0SGW5_9VIBR|nr:MULTISPECIES: hypothetical protein [Vibrio]AIW22384.1 hypothetical protein IX92_25270 [Vibrio coralliilyticus]MCZ2799038.1 hypothetical protein [Vibrio alginolyticus]NOH36938.1 hypothetical protein [Vibrio coralliilyticus]POB47198.1 hypothetical protein CRN52_14050 [Vibrio vulnificus]
MLTNLFRVTSEMGGCNGFSIKPIEQWPDVSPEFDINQLDHQAALLADEQLLVFVDGEETEVAKLTQDLKIHELNDFLNEVFDGFLHEKIAL